MTNQPIVVGGIGGSGTRVIAKILRELNIFIGNDLNVPLDNITYTFLFKRSKWYVKNYSNKAEITRGIRILEKSMTNTKRYTFRELMFLIKATYMMYRFGYYLKDGTGKWALERLQHILFKRQKEISNFISWGWKEANSHLILPELAEYFPNLKYIHTIRHGLDMAYSNTQQQLFTWAPLFGIKIPEKEDEIPYLSFRYWVEVNKKVLQTGNKLGDNKFYSLYFDQFCKNPEEELKKLLSFLEIPYDKNALERVLKIPKVPETTGRFKDHDISIFDLSDISFLESLGFASK